MRAKLTTLNRVKASPASLMQLENLLEAYLEYHLKEVQFEPDHQNLKAKMMI